SVGFEYESCLDLILWEKRTAVLQGYELDASNMGFWTLDKHHVLDVQNGEHTIWILIGQNALEQQLRQKHRFTLMRSL
ncbi:teneurin-3 isoform X1, partial [Tachysurus ichikawai]